MADQPPPRDNRKKLTWEGFALILWVGWINFLCVAGVMRDTLTSALGLPNTLGVKLILTMALIALTIVLTMVALVRVAKTQPRRRAKAAALPGGSEAAPDTEAGKPLKCKRCGAKNPAGQQQCLKCGTAMDIPRFELRRTTRAGRTKIYVNDYRFKYVVLALFALTIALGLYMSRLRLPDEIKQHVLTTIAAERSLEIVDFKELRVAGERKSQGVTEAWCVELAEESGAESFTTYVITRANQLGASPPYNNKQCQDWMDW